MFSCNMEMVTELDFKLEDLVILNSIELFANEKDTDRDGIFELSYKEIIESLPIIFNSSERSNVAKLRNFLNKDSVKKFVTREVAQQGRGKGALVTFTIDRDMFDKIKIRNLLS